MATCYYWLMKTNSQRTTEHWIKTDKGDLYARCWRPLLKIGCENGAPVVIFHDSLGCVEMWRSFPAALAECTGRRVVAYDRLGFGKSDAYPGVLGLAFIEQEAELFFPQLRNAFELEGFVALGHSVGGGMAVHCAARYATDCEALITISAQSFVEERTRAGIIEAKKHFKNEEVFNRLRLYHQDKAHWVLHSWYDTWLSAAFSAWSLDAILPLVKCPTLVIHGSDDEYGSVLHPRKIASMVGGPSQLEIVSGAKHMPHREQESWTVKRIDTFLTTAHG